MVFSVRSTCRATLCPPGGPVNSSQPLEQSTVRAEIDTLPADALERQRAPVAAETLAARAWRFVRRPSFLKNAATLGVGGGSFLVLSKRFVGAQLGYDEQFFVWGGWSILKGLVPYKDFLEHKPPMAFVTHAIALGLFGFENNRYRLFFQLFSLVAICGWQLALLTRNVDRVLAAILGVALAFLYANPSYHDSSLDDTESIGFGYYFIGIAFLLARTRHQRAFDVLGGIFLSLCVLSKEPFIPCVLPTWLVCFACRELSGDFRTKALAYVRDTTTGVVAVFLACCLYMIPTGSMSHYLAMLNRYKVMFRDPNQGYCVVLGIFKPHGFWADIPQQWAKINAAFFNQPTLGFLTPFFVASAVFTWIRSKALFFATAATVIGAMYTTTISNCYWMHYYTMALTGLFLVLSVGLIAMAQRAALRRAPNRYWVWAVAAVPAALQIGPSLSRELSAEYASIRPAEPIPGVFAFVEQNSTPADRIFTTGPPGLYVVTNRIAATRTSSVTDEIIASFPGTTDEEKTRHLYDDLAEHKPKIVILDPEHGNRKVRYMAASVMPFLRDFQYEKVSDYIYLRP
jgi:hypothetical protein